MGFLDALFGGGKEAEAPKPKKEKKAAAPSPAPAHVEAPGISPEVVAVIAAAVCAFAGTGQLAIRIRHTSNVWALTGRQQLMDGRQFA